MGADSWLADFDSLIDLYRSAFGHDAVNAIDYEAAVDVDGSVLPAFFGSLGIPLPPGFDLAHYQLNRSEPGAGDGRPGDRRHGVLRRILGKR